MFNLFVSARSLLQRLKSDGRKSELYKVHLKSIASLLTSWLDGSEEVAIDDIEHRVQYAIQELEQLLTLTADMQISRA